MKTQLAEVVVLRKNNEGEEALLILKDLLGLHPNDPDVNSQMAVTCDFMGKESEAAPFYERALANGLVDD